MAQGSGAPAENTRGDDVLDEAEVTVLAAVGDAVVRLEALRLCRSVEIAAFDNVWRG